MTANTAQRPDGVTLTAIWFIVGSVFFLLGIAAMLIFAYPAVIRETSGSDLYFALAGLSFALAILILFAVANLTTAIGLLRLKSWSRIMSFVLAAIGLFAFPFGTAVGALIIWYMLGDEAKRAFGMAPPPPPPAQTIDRQAA